MADRYVPQAYLDYILDRIAECTEQAMCSSAPTTYYNAVWPQLWTVSTAYTVGALVHPPTPNGKIYECTIGGTTGGVEPGWGTVQDSTFVDGTVTWKTHDNFSLVNRAIQPSDFSKSDTTPTGSRLLTLNQAMGPVTHTAGTVSHNALICASDKSLRYVTPAVATFGGGTLEAGRMTVFYALELKVNAPEAT